MSSSGGGGGGSRGRGSDLTKPAWMTRSDDPLRGPGSGGGPPGVGGGGDERGGPGDRRGGGGGRPPSRSPERDPYGRIRYDRDRGGRDDRDRGDRGGRGDRGPPPDYHRGGGDYGGGPYGRGPPPPRGGGGPIRGRDRGGGGERYGGGRDDPYGRRGGGGGGGGGRRGSRSPPGGGGGRRGSDRRGGGGGGGGGNRSGIYFRSLDEERAWVDDRRRKRRSRPSLFDVEPTPEQAAEAERRAAALAAMDTAARSHLPPATVMDGDGSGGGIYGPASAGGGASSAGGRSSSSRSLAHAQPQQTRHARRLYIGNIPPDLAEQDVHDFFRRSIATAMGIDDYTRTDDPILSVYINQERRFAFLEFRTMELCTATLAFDGIDILGRGKVKVKRPNDYNPALAPTPNPDALPHFDTSKLGIVSQSVPDGPNKIFIGGLPYHLTESQVLELLGAFGRVKAFHLVKADPAAVTSKGYCFVEYADPAVTAVAVVGLNGMDMGGGKALSARMAAARGTTVPSAPGGADAIGGAGAASAVPLPSSGMDGGAGAALSAAAPGLPVIHEGVVDGVHVGALLDAAFGKGPMPAMPPAMAAAAMANPMIPQPIVANPSGAGAAGMMAMMGAAGGAMMMPGMAMMAPQQQPQMQQQQQQPAAAPFAPPQDMAQAHAIANAASAALDAAFGPTGGAAAGGGGVAAAAAPVGVAPMMQQQPAPPPPPPPPMQAMNGNGAAGTPTSHETKLGPTRILVLLNMVMDEDLATDEDHKALSDEVREECAKFGRLVSMNIPRPQDGVAPSAVKKIFLEYATVQDATGAERELAGRAFGPNVVEATYFNEDDYLNKRFR